MASRIGEDLASPGSTGDFGQPHANRLARLRVGRSQRSAHTGKEGVEARPISLTGCEPVPGGNQARCFSGDALQLTLLVGEELQRQTGVDLRVVPVPPLELSVLVVLHQVVVGVAGKGERVEPQCVHGRNAQKSEIGVRRLQVREIEGDQVVSQQKCRPLGQCIQLPQRGHQVAASKHQPPARVGAQCGESMNASVPDPDFEVQ